MADPTQFLVLDVETNGLSSLNDDLLSISIFKPDDQRMYNRFLPLELANEVYTTQYNGITKKMLKGIKPLAQDEIDQLIDNFELDRRIILTYGGIDEKFIKNYLKRKRLKGFECMTFYNFKRNIISSAFSSGNVTKDDLCNVLGIEGVTAVHSGENDCILEWTLFSALNGKKLLVRHDYVYEYSADYIVPASDLAYYPNWKYAIELPKIKIIGVPVFELPFTSACSKAVERFETNISGHTIEHLINSMLDVTDTGIDSSDFIQQNWKKLKRIGKLPSSLPELIIPVKYNRDGTITAVRQTDEDRIAQINKTTLRIKSEITPLIEYVRTEIFRGEPIFSQELVINTEINCLAHCDLSNRHGVLEIKTSSSLDLNKHKYQLYCQSNGRNCYILQMDWYSQKTKRLIISRIEMSVQSV